MGWHRIISTDRAAALSVNNQGDVKIEWDPRQADKITGFYSQSDAYDGNVAVLALSFPAQNVFPTKLGGSTWVHVFSPSIVNSARVGFTRVVWKQGVPTDPSGEFGLTGNSKVGITFGAQQYVGFSFQNISGYQRSRDAGKHWFNHRQHLQLWRQPDVATRRAFVQHGNRGNPLSEQLHHQQ